MRKALAFLVILLVVSVAGCIGTSTSNYTTSSISSSSTMTSSSTGQGYITVTDMLGRTVKVPTNVSKVVAVGPGALRILVYLNATKDVVGIEEFEKRFPYGRPYILAHPELLKLPVIGPGGPGKLPDMEALIKVHPQVIFMVFVSRQTADEVQEKTGIPVVVLSYGTLKNFTDPVFFKSLLLAGKILGKEKRAEEVIKFIEEQQSYLENLTKGLKSPRVYVGGIGFKGAHGITSTFTDYAPFTVLHLDNVASNLRGKNGWVQVDKEFLLKENPDYIFIDEGGLKIILEDYRSNPDFYNSLKAVEEGHVYGVLPYNFYNTNIGIAIADAYYIGKVIYPERFKNIDPVKKANEIFTFLVGKPVYGELAEEFGGFGKIDLASGNVTYGLPTNP
ncbi:iron ABC transporter substrate-binding protein [Thermococcus sp. AM4]|uniref:iron ABC transporter substrate-binding protein n=1 Tax=Thermococcus sp. (strain AM4) TaxID=246969 RepID=UPI0001870532|nr:iron ABC transporter substrate-binding protein [Thermococcus sp. AM4]EEB74742.1 ABC-type iron(III)-siderophore transport system, periplasmic component [Thermococcus sp. AM4]